MTLTNDRADQAETVCAIATEARAAADLATAASSQDAVTESQVRSSARGMGATIRMEICPPEGAHWHPYADAFPWIENAAFRELVEDIRKNGVLEPIVFFEGQTLDGRNRYMAARELCIEYPRIEYEGDDPLGFVISRNLARRHLTESQRAMVAASLAKMPHGGDRRSDQAENLPVVSQGQAAEMLNVSDRSVRTAKTVQEKGAPELVAAVNAGKVSVSAAAVIAKQDEDEQRRLVAEEKTKQSAAKLRKATIKAKPAEKLPKAEPLMDEGNTSQDLCLDSWICEIVDFIGKVPSPGEAVARIPAAERDAVDTAAFRSAAVWLIAFSDIWEQQKVNKIEAARTDISI